MRPDYNCGQQELYTICRAGWSACSHNLTAFTAIKPKYTAAFIADQLANVADAANLPDATSRSGNSEVYRTDLIRLSIECVTKFKYLRRYIVGAYPRSERNMRLNIAGKKYLKGAINQNWESVNAMNTAGSKFITDNAAKLSDNLNMPTTFLADFDAASNAFLAQHTLFIDEENFLASLTDAKIEENNKIYHALMEMFGDGQTIFQNNKATKKQFVFSELHYLTSGAGTAGIKGSIVDANTDLPIEGVEVSIPKKSRTTTTDSNGRYEIIQIASGLYNIKFTKEGYQPISLEKYEIKLGTTSNLNQIMVPIPQDDNES